MPTISLRGAGGRGPSKLPPLATQAATLVTALTRWTAAGFPRRSPERTAEILAICAGCEHYDAGRCGACGCVLKSKAAMATESCPLAEPKWTAEPEHRD